MIRFTPLKCCHVAVVIDFAISRFRDSAISRFRNFAILRFCDQLVLINANAVQARFVPRKVPFDDDVDLKCIVQTANAIAQTHMVLSPEAAARYGAPEEWGRGKLHANNKN